MYPCRLGQPKKDFMAFTQLYMVRLNMQGICIPNLYCRNLPSISTIYAETAVNSPYPISLSLNFSETRLYQQTVQRDFPSVRL